VHNVVSSCHRVVRSVGDAVNSIQGLQETWRYCVSSICVACQVQNVFFRRGCQFAFAGVDVGDDGAPGFGLG
jgi:hypothetical protein